MTDYIQVGGMFASTLLGSLIGFFIARATIRDQFFYAAAAKLKQAFIDILRRLNLPEDRFIDLDAINCMDDCFWKHERAVIEFRYALQKWQWSSFDKAWELYKGKETGPDKLANRYFARPGWQQIALKDIEAILAFTEPSSCPFWDELKYKLNKKSFLN